MGPMGLMRLMGMASGGAKISARKPVATSHPSIAPDLSHACVRHRLDAVANPWRRFYHPGFLNIIRDAISTARLKTGAVRFKWLATSWARRVFRPTGPTGPTGSGAMASVHALRAVGVIDALQVDGETWVGQNGGIDLQAV